MEKREKIFIAVCGGLFTGLCLLHYFSGRPLWCDETSILQNITDLSTAQIFGPLKSCQAFPRLYLYIIKLFAAPYNYSVFSLRFFPLLAMLGAFAAWSAIFRKEFPAGLNQFLALFSLSSSYAWSYYGAELKHYSMDVLAAGLFCLYLYNQQKYRQRPPSRLFILGTLILPCLLLLSYSGYFLFWIVTYNFCVFSPRNKKLIPLALAYTVICSLLLAFIFLVDIRHTMGQKCLFGYWKDYFLCSDSFYCFFKSFGEGLRKLTVWWFGDRKIFYQIASFFMPFFTISLFAYGINSLKKNKLVICDLSSLGLVLFLELMAVGLMQKYPFTGQRITLFFSPVVFYMIVKGLDAIKKPRLVRPILCGFYAIFLAVCAINSFARYLGLYFK